jgi:hypothetical protein
MTTPTKTISEREFENFLSRNHLAFEPIPQAGAPRPDYLVTCDAGTIVFEVKELSEDANFHKQPFQVSTRTVGAHIRSKIAEARKQVQYGTRQGFPSVLLIYNDIDPMHLFGTENHDFAAAMYGDHTLRIGLQTGKIIDSFHGRNRSFAEGKNTSFSALGRLAPDRSEMKVTLFENPFAKLPLPYGRLPTCFGVVRAEITLPP